MGDASLCTPDIALTYKIASAKTVPFVNYFYWTGSLELIRAKQRYLDVSYAIQLSTSAAMLNYLRGDAPPPKDTERVDHFVDARTGKEVGSGEGRSLTQLIADVGLNPKSKRDRDRVKRALKRWGFDYDRMENWSYASYLRKYPVLDDRQDSVFLLAALSLLEAP